MTPREFIKQLEVYIETWKECEECSVNTLRMIRWDIDDLIIDAKQEDWSKMR